MDPIFAELTALQIAVIVGATIGAVELVKNLFDKNFRAAVVIAAAAVAGGLIALPVGAEWYLGMLVGLSGSGVITSLQNIGTRS